MNERRREAERAVLDAYRELGDWVGLWEWLHETGRNPVPGAIAAVGGAEDAASDRLESALAVLIEVDQEEKDQDQGEGDNACRTTN